MLTKKAVHLYHSASTINLLTSTGTLIIFQGSPRATTYYTTARVYGATRTRAHLSVVGTFQVFTEKDAEMQEGRQADRVISTSLPRYYVTKPGNLPSSVDFLFAYYFLVRICSITYLLKFQVYQSRRMITT